MFLISNFFWKNQTKVVDNATHGMYYDTRNQVAITQHKMKRGVCMVRDKAEPYFGLMVAMKKRRKTQAELAELINVNRSTFNQKLNRINGKDFYYSEAQLIAKALDIKVSDFS